MIPELTSRVDEIKATAELAMKLMSLDRRGQKDTIMGMYSVDKITKTQVTELFNLLGLAEA
jgi:hypothetical protein